MGRRTTLEEPAPIGIVAVVKYKTVVNVELGLIEMATVSDGGEAVIGTTVVRLDVGLIEMVMVSARPSSKYEGEPVDNVDERLARLEPCEPADEEEPWKLPRVMV